MATDNKQETGRPVKEDSKTVKGASVAHALGKREGTIGAAAVLLKGYEKDLKDTPTGRSPWGTIHKISVQLYKVKMAVGFYHVTEKLNCKTCQGPPPGGIRPSHIPGSGCESGHETHCTCDMCF